MASGRATTAEPLHSLFAQVYRAILGDAVRLPSLPDVALRVRTAMQDPNYTTSSIAQAIQVDPGTAAYLLRIANSALYRGVTQVDTVETAILRLGPLTTRNLVTAHALKALFRTRSPLLAGLLRESWTRSTRLAAMASILAQRSGRFCSDRAILAGLVQDLGMLPLIAALEDRKEPLPDAEDIAATLDQFAGKVSSALLTHWRFDQELVTVAQTRGDWLREGGAEPDLADLLIVARLHVCAADGLQDDLPWMDDVPAYRKLALGDVSDGARLTVLLDADSDVRELASMLGA